MIKSNTQEGTSHMNSQTHIWNINFLCKYHNYLQMITLRM